MVEIIIFYVHIVAFAAAFTKRWQDEGLAEGFLALFFMALIFFVGWSMASFLCRLLLPAEGFGPLLDRDAFSLLLLTGAETIFYYFYLRTGEPGAEPSDRG